MRLKPVLKSLFQLSGLWLFAFAFCVSFYPSLSGAGARTCSVLLSTPRESLEQLIQHEITNAGFKVTTDSKPGFFARYKAKKLFAKLDSILLTDTLYRNEMTERVLDFEIASRLDPLSDISMNKKDRTALRRLVLRTLISRGLGARADFKSSPTKLQTFKRALNRLFLNPRFRLFTQLKIPGQTIQLSEAEIWDLATNGEAAWLERTSLLESVKLEQRSQTIRTLNAAAVNIATIAFIVGSAVTAYPKISADYDASFKAAQVQKTASFKAQASQLTDVHVDDVALAMAKGEEKAVLDSFRNRFHSEPTAAELKQIRQEICTIRYGQMLNATQQIQCLGL